jgi:hypothetical protein
MTRTRTEQASGPYTGDRIVSTPSPLTTLPASGPGSALPGGSDRHVADLDARDVIILIGYLPRLEPAEFDNRARRLLGVILDGLRAPD